MMKLRISNEVYERLKIIKKELPDLSYSKIILKIIE